jgi:hypothetical protein
MPATAPPPAPAPEPPGSPEEPKSFLRALIGVVSLVLSMIVIPAGFVLLVTDMQAGPANRRTMMNALGVLSIGGGLLALGVSMLIWEMSVRYGVRR